MMPTDAWKQTTTRGGKSYMKPQRFKDNDGEVVISGIHTYGDTVHLFIERNNYKGAFHAWLQKLE